MKTIADVDIDYQENQCNQVNEELNNQAKLSQFSQLVKEFKVENELSNKWEEPISLDTTKEIDFPVDYLPKIIRDAVVEYQCYVQLPMPIVVVSALSALSFASQHSIDVTRGNLMKSPVSLFCIAIAESGERKSSCDKTFFKPIIEWQKKALNKNNEEQRLYKAKKTGWEKEKKKLEKEETNSTEFENHFKVEPTKPVLPKIIYEMITAEKLIEVLSFNWSSILIKSGEAGLIIGSHSMSEEHIVKSLSIFNKLWSDEGIDYDTKNSGSFFISGKRVSCNFMMQPAIFKRLVSENKGISKDIGFLARFLIVYPKSRIGYRPIKQMPEKLEALENFNSIVTKLLETSNDVGNSEINPTVLKFDPDAQVIWQIYHDEIEEELKPCGKYYSIKEFGAKAPEQIARLSALFYRAETLDIGNIKSDHVSMAGEIIKWFLDHNLNMFSFKEEVVEAKMLSEWLVQKAKRHEFNPDELLISTIQNKVPYKFRNIAILNRSLIILEEYHHIKKIKDRPHTICINSKLLL